MKTFFKTLFSVLSVALFSIPAQGQDQPNIIFILCDDLGYGDLGVLYQDARQNAGQPAFDTPELDTLANQGAILSRHYTSAPVCAPARASLLLGVHQGHANVRNNQFDKELENNHTLGTVLSQAGYATAAIGKWGLQGGPEKAGDPSSPSFPTKRGFDFFFGYLDHSAGHRHYPKEDPVDGNDPDGASTIWEMNSNITDQLDNCYSTDLFTARAKKWISDHNTASPSQPFFLYLSYTAPHAALQVPTQAYPSGGGSSGGLQWLGTPGNMINTASGGTRDAWIHPDFASQAGWNNSNKRHATMVRRIDSAVGDLIDLLTDLNLDDNTLIVFTSDNGPHAEGSWSGVVQNPQFFRSYADMDGIKRDTWEAGIRVPTLVRWPGGIPAGRVSDHASQFHDWLPTFADLAGIAPPARTDGVSLLPALTGNGTQRQGTVYVEYSTSGSTPSYGDFEAAHRGASWNQQQVVHVGGLKGIRHNTTSPNTTFRVYDTLNDRKETTNLAGAVGSPSQSELEAAVLRLRRPNTSAPRAYDNEQVPSLALVADAAGVNWRAFEQDFPWVPDFSGLTEVANGTSAGLDLGVRTRDDQIGIEFSGYLDVPTDGTYTFYLNADTGAFMRLHQMQLIDADFAYIGGSEFSASVNLEAGLHPFTIAYRRATGGTPSLDLEWSGPGLTREPVGASNLVASAVEAVPPSGAAWLLDENAGGVTAEAFSMLASEDFSASGVTWTTATPGIASSAALNFPGTVDGNVRTNLSAADLGIDGAGAKTITGWFRTTHNLDSQMFFGWSPTNGGGAGQDLRLGLDASGFLRFEVSSGFALYETTALNDGEWHFVGVVIDAGDTTSDVQFFIDGALVNPTSSNGRAINTAGTGAAPREEILLGIGNPLGTQEWHGDVDEVRVDDVALTEAELDQRYTDMTPSVPALQWRLEEGDGSTTISEEQSGVVSDTLGAGLSWSSDTPGPGSTASLQFNGSGRLGLNLNAQAAGISGSGDKTLIAWIKTSQADKRYFWGWSPDNGLVAGSDLRLAIEDGGKLRFEVSAGFARYDAIALNDNEWHMIAVIVEAGDTINSVDFYIDGQLVTPTGNTTALINTSPTGAGGFNTPNEFFFGSGGNTTDQQWLGWIDDFRIVPAAMSVSELDSIRDAMLTATPQPASFSSWVEEFFPGISDPAIIGLDADPDADGWANGIEYLLGGSTDPSSADAVVAPSGAVTGSDFVFEFTRRDDSETADITLTVEVGTDLQNWPEEYVIGADTASSSAGVSITENGASDDLITVTIPHNSDTRKFVRLKVKKTP